jgi:hypothetical protein
VKLSAAELAQVEAMIARGTVKQCAAGADLPSNGTKPTSFVELARRRRANIGKAYG